MTTEQFQWVIGLLIANFGAIIGVGWRLSRYLIRFEIQHNLMWSQYSKDHKITI